MNPSDIEYDEAKRQATLAMRGLDFKEAHLVFQATTTTAVDDRRDYGEVRYLTVGMLNAEVVIVVWTWRGPRRRIISMRKCNAQERDNYFDEVGRD